MTKKTIFIEVIKIFFWGVVIAVFIEKGRYCLACFAAFTLISLQIAFIAMTLSVLKEK